MVLRWRLRAGLTALGLLAGACVDDGATTTPAPEPRAASPLASGPSSLAPVALIATEGRDSALYVATPGAPLPPPAARFSHLGDGSVRAVTSTAGPVFATASVRPGRDRSFDGGLFRLDPASGAVKLLCEDVVHASRPLIDQEGRLFVVQGWAGAQPSATELRRDDLAVVEVAPETGATTTVHTFHGYMVSLAGAHRGELVLYRVGPAGADLTAVDRDSGAERLLVATLPPFARDFSIDEPSATLVYRGRHESDPRRWVVDSVDLAGGQTARLYEGDTFALAPHAWPGGGVSLNPSEGGMALLGSADTLRAPLGPGVDWVRAVSGDGRFVALLHIVDGQLPLPFVVDRQSQAPLRLPAVAGARMAIAGFVGPAAQGGSP